MMPLLNTATSAARRAGDMALRYADRIESLTVRSKSPNELVTEVDEAAERIIVDHIRNGYPDHAFLGEEGGARGDSEFEWIIDPLDGTTNYIHRFPVFCVSVALRRQGELQLGVIYDPLRQEMFTCTRGGGARLNERRIRVSSHQALAGSLIGTGFPYRRNLQWVDVYMRMLRQVMRQTSGVRRPGAAALDLAYVAAGRLDGFWEFGLEPWDIAAGALLIEEAGGWISGLQPDTDCMESGHVLAGTPKVYGDLRKLFDNIMRNYKQVTDK
ncbi:MAG: inositol monophosphatase family protein [Gammaproteobacteria bacterium]|nr:inositol monophosphatase family protein [Gammaproteobacteria bacterium]